jgi:hypothetical protein
MPANIPIGCVSHRGSLKEWESEEIKRQPKVADVRRVAAATKNTKSLLDYGTTGLTDDWSES